MTNIPIVILKDVASEKEAVPIWIGLSEASAIATELEKIALERPMTHDLLKNIIGEVGVRVDRVEVHDFKDDIFYATIYLVGADGKEIEVDSRPSDALALALRSRRAHLRRAQGDRRARNRIDKRPDVAAALPAADGARDEPGILEQLDDEDFGKWKM